MILILDSFFFFYMENKNVENRDVSFLVFTSAIQFNIPRWAEETSQTFGMKQHLSPAEQMSVGSCWWKTIDICPMMTQKQRQSIKLAFFHTLLLLHLVSLCQQTCLITQLRLKYM